MRAEAPAAEAVEVTIRGLAAGGDGVGALPDGRVVFVPRTVPGDRVRVRLVGSRSRWARGTAEELLASGPGRVEPLCPLYDECGGCQLQHVPYEEQLVWKGRFVADALERIAGLERVEVPEVVPSPRTRGYRTRMSFTLRRLRGGRVVAGLHALGRGARVIDVDGECVLPVDPVAACWRSLRRAWGPGARRLPEGGQLRLTLRSVEGGAELLVEGGSPGWAPESLVADVDGLVGVWHRPSGALRAALVEGGSSPGLGDAFEQVNPAAADRVRAHVLEVVGDPLGAGRPTLVEAYCGTGALGRVLAERGWTVTGIEANASAAAAARLGTPGGFQVVEGRTEDHLSTLLPCDALVVNPPRTGLAASIPDEILAAPPERVVYVSCDPATLARDLGRLGAGYAMAGLRCFDLFPHTAHVETVALLERREAGP